MSLTDAQEQKVRPRDPSIPDQGCCQLFVPKHPATKAEFAEVEHAEAHYDAKEMVRLGVENAAEEKFSFPVAL